MNPAEMFRKAVLHLMDVKQVKQSVLADELNFTRPNLNSYIKGDRGFSEDKRLIIAEYFGKTYIDMLKIGQCLTEGKDPRVEPTPHAFIIQTHTEAQKNFINTEHYIPVPLYEKGKIAAFSDGSAFDPFETPESHVMIYSPELNHRTKHRLVAGKVGGDSMKPLIPEGSIIVVDLNDREYLKDKIYLVSDDEDIDFHLAVKKVRKFEKEKGFLLLSENLEYAPRLVVESDWLRLCVGRVVWMWRSFDKDF